VRTRRGDNRSTDDITYIPLGSSGQASNELRNATAMQDTTDYESLRAAMDAEYYWRGVKETFQIADDSFTMVSRETRDRLDISAAVMARASHWVSTIELAAEGAHLYGALVAYTQGVGDSYSAIETWARTTKNALRP
jgi:hypothetical protein